MYWATCGTSSTMSRRVWSLDAIGPTIPRGSRGGPTRRSRSADGHAGAGQGLDGDAGSRVRCPGPSGPGRSRRRCSSTTSPASSANAAQLVGRDEAQPVAADPAPGRLALAAFLEDRRQGHGRRSPRRAAPSRPWSRSSPVSGSSARPLEDDPAVEPGQVLGVGQPDVDDGQRRPGARWSASVSEGRPLRGPGRQDQQRVERDEGEPEPAGVGQAQADDVGLDERQAVAPSGRRRGRASRARASIAGSRSTPVTGGRPRPAGRPAGRSRPPARGSGRRPGRRARGTGRGRPGRRRGRGRTGAPGRPRSRVGRSSIGASARVAVAVERLGGNRSAGSRPAQRTGWPALRRTASALIASRAARLAAIAVVSAWSYGGETSTMSMPGEVDRADDLADRPEHLAGEHPARLRRARSRAPCPGR